MMGKNKRFIVVQCSGSTSCDATQPKPKVLQKASFQTVKTTELTNIKRSYIFKFNRNIKQ